MARLQRKDQRPEELYVCPDGQTFFTPDGEGRIWYDTLHDALQEHGVPTPVNYLMEEPEDY